MMLGFHHDERQNGRGIDGCHLSWINFHVMVFRLKIAEDKHMIMLQ